MSGTKIEVAGKDGVFKEVKPDSSVNIDMIKPDPHKEWVKIREGCPMPEEGVDIAGFDNEGQFYGTFDNGVFRTHGMTIDQHCVTHWRYPHPDPEDV